MADFDVRGGSRGPKPQATCRDCKNIYNRSWKKKNSDLIKRWKLRKGCQRCGFKADHSCQLDIDHIEPKKAKSKDRQAVNTSWSKQRLKTELSKCQVLCANCHRLKTFQDGTMFQTYENRVKINEQSSNFY